MIQTFTILGYGFQIARWGLIFAVCILLYRHVPLPSLPWIAAHYGITFVFGFFAGTFFDFLRAFVHSTAHAGATLASIGAGSILLANAIKFLIALLIISETTYLIYTNYPDIQSKLLIRFVLVHKYIKSLGVTLVALTLIKPVTWLVIWIFHHPNTVA